MWTILVRLALAAATAWTSPQAQKWRELEQAERRLEGLDERQALDRLRQERLRQLWDAERAFDRLRKDKP